MCVALLVLVCCALLARARRIGVCITGQLSRAEIDNKIARFIEPSCGTYDVFVVLVLARGQPVFTNPRRGLTQPGPFADVEAVAARLRNVSCVLRVRYDTSPQVSDPLTDQRYANAVSEFEQDDSINYQRATNHVRQWQANYKCWDQLERMGTFHFYVKLREDVVFQRDWTPPRDWLSQRAIRVPACLAWGGVNDKMAVITGRSHAFRYFISPLADYYTNYGSVIHRGMRDGLPVRNPESYLRSSLQLHNATVHMVCADELPACAARIAPDGRFCFLAKDVDNISRFHNGTSKPCGRLGMSCYSDGERPPNFACIAPERVTWARRHMCVKSDDEWHVSDFVLPDAL